MKQYITNAVAAVSMVIFIFAIDSNAQSSRRLVATIPFDFHIGNKVMPRGRYEFETANRSALPGSLIVRSLPGSGRQTMIALSMTGEQGKAGEAPTIVFNQYGSVYYLSSITADVGGLALRLGRTTAEKQIAKQILPAEPVTVRLANASGR